MRLRLLLAAAVSTAVAPASPAADAPAPRPSVPALIDKYLDAAIADAGVTPAGQADDATLVRRLTLDLVGRIPTAAEADAYVASTDPDKRAKLVDRLLASPGFARHQAALFEAMFYPEGNGRGSGAFREYLTAAVRENKPWDKVFREVLTPDETDPKLKGAAEFVRSRVSDADKLTNDVSVTFFGVNVSCAQCHDHPLVADWTQDHFYGMKAFLARTFDNGGFLGERGYGTVKYKPTKGPERTARMMFLTGTVVEDPSGKEPTADDMKKEKAELDKAKAAKTPPPAPAFRARAKLVEVALADANADFFARNLVNRMWHRYFGAGLVGPLDQMHSENPPAHPDLLAALARDVRANGYDLQRLTRGLVMSQAYARSSRYESEGRPDGKLFAVARLKPMTPTQLAASLKIAATDPAALDGKPDEVEKKLEQLEASARGFAALIASPSDHFQIGVGEALLFSNGDRLTKEFLTDGPGTALGRVKTMADPKEAVGFLVKTAFGRPATAEETDALAAYVGKRKGREADAYRQVLWALVTGPEFRFSY
ncbi:MAG: hypothetical protein C0501_15235 [Isosphaera sp.]|nr:hypothetical protein [Isosphaera sp.]